MPYRLVYNATLEFYGPGAGQMAPNSQKQVTFNSPGGQNVPGSGTGGALASADITTLLTAMQTDLSTQMNNTIAVPQGWISGLG